MNTTNQAEKITDPLTAHERRAVEFHQTTGEGNAPRVTELWPDDLKHALATVVSLMSRHASARESAEWSVFWTHYELVTTQRDELLAACKAAQRFLDELVPIAQDNGFEINSNDGVDWDTRFVIQDAIAKAEGSAQ